MDGVFERTRVSFAELLGNIHYRFQHSIRSPFSQDPSARMAAAQHSSTARTVQVSNTDRYHHALSGRTASIVRRPATQATRVSTGNQQGTVYVFRGSKNRAADVVFRS